MNQDRAIKVMIKGNAMTSDQSRIGRKDMAGPGHPTLNVWFIPEAEQQLGVQRQGSLNQEQCPSGTDNLCLPLYAGLCARLPRRWCTEWEGRLRSGDTDVLWAGP